jgi:hypothetical protein
VFKGVEKRAVKVWRTKRALTDILKWKIEKMWPGRIEQVGKQK